MSVKNNDIQGRHRSKIIAFRVSPEENAVLERKVYLSGATKQDYLIQSTLNQEIVVQGNPYVYRSLKKEFDYFIDLFKKVNSLEEVNLDYLDILVYFLSIAIHMRNKKEAQIKFTKDTFGDGPNK